jgi:FkbM family methyltransferase
MDEVFFHQSYYWLYSQARPHTTLIDIGAFIGDTAAYFAMNPNIDRVIAYEPHPKTFKILSDNVRSLPEQAASKIMLQKRPILDREVYVNNSSVQITGTNKVVAGDSSRSIKATTLEHELKGLRNVMIKSDCEGAEYQIFRDVKSLRNVYAMQLEYHKGHAQLQSLFESAGFECRHSNNRDIGYLTASRTPAY